MKKFLSILSLAALMIQPALAQFPSYAGVAFGEMLTNNPGLVALGGTTNGMIIYANAAQTNFVQGSALTNIGVLQLRVPKDRGISFSPYFCQTNNVLSGSNLVFNFNITYDGTNWTTMNPITATFAPTTNSMQGAFVNSACRAFTNFPRAVLDNVFAIRLDSIQSWNSNHTYLSNCTWSYFP